MSTDGAWAISCPHVISVTWDENCTMKVDIGRQNGISHNPVARPKKPLFLKRPQMGPALSRSLSRPHVLAATWDENSTIKVDVGLHDDVCYMHDSIWTKIACTWDYIKSSCMLLHMSMPVVDTAQSSYVGSHSCHLILLSSHVCHTYILPRMNLILCGCQVHWHRHVRKIMGISRIPSSLVIMVWRRGRIRL